MSKNSVCCGEKHTGIRRVSGWGLEEISDSPLLKLSVARAIQSDLIQPQSTTFVNTEKVSVKKGNIIKSVFIQKR